MPIAKAGRIIETLEDWERQAPPKSQHQWVDGRSAKEAARAWLEQGGGAMPQEVHEALRRHPRFGLVRRWDAEPEARLRFDAFAGEPRNTDLLVIATRPPSIVPQPAVASAGSISSARVSASFMFGTSTWLDHQRA